MLLLLVVGCCFADYMAPIHKGHADEAGKWHIDVDVLEQKKPAATSYGVDILNSGLPQEVEDCYVNLRTEVLELESSNPAEFGESTCRGLEFGLSCTSNLANERLSDALNKFIVDTRLMTEIICDPECPFAQLESCKTKVVAMGNDGDKCWFVDVLKCVDTKLPSLNCKNTARALAYWAKHKVIGQLIECQKVTFSCLQEVEACLKPVTDYLSTPDMEQVCRERNELQQCMRSTLLQTCGLTDNSVVVELVEYLDKWISSVC